MSASYGSSPSGASSPTALYSVTGQYLARAHLTRKQRAKLAADLADGTAGATPLTVKQAAALTRVPVLDVTGLRCNGKHGINGHANGNGHGETLAEHIARSSAAERLEAACAIGVDVIWDTMVNPIVGPACETLADF